MDVKADVDKTVDAVETVGVNVTVGADETMSLEATVNEPEVLKETAADSVNITQNTVEHSFNKSKDEL